MTPEDVYRSYVEGENARDRSRMEAVLHPGLSVVVNGVPQLADRNADAAATDALLALYPDYERVITRLMVADSTVIAEWVMRASSTPDRGIQELEIHGCSIADIEAGRIVSASLYSTGDALERIIEQAT